MGLTYLVVKVAEGKSDLFSLWDPSDAEIKPGLVVVVAHIVGRAVSRHPKVNLIFLLPPACLSQVPRAKV